MGKKGSQQEMEAGLSRPSLPASPAGYAPSPNTCSQALARANQLRVQALLRQLLIVPSSGSASTGNRLSTLRVLRRTMRELDNQLSWLTQVDFFETMERILRNETLDEDTDWRLIHDTTQLLIETLPRASFEPDPHTVGQILAYVVQNLGHQRSEVRRASLLLINMHLNERGRLLDFQRLLRIFIDYGLANGRNKEAQRGAILSLPLLMTEQAVEGEDLMPLIRCLSELLVKTEPQLFYSLYLALQRLQLTVGEPRFSAYLRQCNPDAVALYKQAASRSGSLEMQPPMPSLKGSEGPKPLGSSSAVAEGQEEAMLERDQQPVTSDSGSKQVTFEDEPRKSLALEPSTSGSGTGSGQGGSTDSQAGQAKGPVLDTADGDQLDRISSNLGYIPPADSDGLSSPSETGSSLNGSRGSSVRQFGAQQQAGGGGGGPTNLTGVANFLEQSSVSSTCSSEANLVDPIHYMNASALSGHPLDNYDLLHHIDHSNTGLAINDICVSCSPTIELGPAAQNELKFGIFPRHLVTAALGPRYLDRLEALQEMMCIIRDSPINHLAILMTYFDSFLSQFLDKLMDSGTDYKVELIAIDMIETIVIKTKFSAIQYIRPMVGLLVKSLGDPRAVFRDNSVRVIHKMMAFLPPQHVIDAIFEHKHSRSPLVREESVNRVTAAVLDYDRNEFNLTKLCYHVLPMLADHQASVRLAALECIATLANALGPERIGSLLTAAEAVQTGCDYDGFLDAINARLMRRALPRCQADGSIRYVIKPFLNTAGTIYHQEHQAADVRWVLEAPSRHQHQHHQHQSHHEPEFHSHRPGIYSPVSASGPRRFSIPAAIVQQQQEESANHQHHHHHPHHHQHHNNRNHHHQGSNNYDGDRHNLDSQQRPVESQTDAAAGQPTVTDGQRQANANSSRKANSYEPAIDPQQTAATNSRQQVQPGPKSSGTDRRDSSKRLGDSAQIETQTSGNISEIGKRRQSKQASGSQEQLARDAGRVGGPKLSDAKLRPIVRENPSEVGRSKRSSSQDSTSSTDTILPSDSIIYTDIVQAYELNRHQSRYQQTSFDYDSGPVGRVPVGVEPSTKANNSSFHKNSMISHGPRGPDLASLKTNRACSPERSGSEPSGSESPQTIMEQVDSRKQSEVGSTASKRQVNSSSKEEGEINDEPSQRQAQTSDRRASRHSSVQDRSLSGDKIGYQQQEENHQQECQRSELEHDNDGRKKSSASRKQSHQASEQERQVLSGRKSMGDRGEREQSNSSSSFDDGKQSGDRCDTSEPKEGAKLGHSNSDRVLRSLGSLETKNSSTEAKQSQEMRRKNNDDDDEDGDGEKQQQQQPRARALVRQSASAMAAEEQPIGSTEASGDRSSPEYDLMRASSQKNDPGGASNQASDTYRQAPRAPQMGSRQESTGTSDSYSSQRDFSDHATQTPTARHGNAGDNNEDDSRQSRRRRSSRRREPREEPTKGDESDEQVGATRGATGSGKELKQQQHQEEMEVRRRASRSQPPPPRQRHLSRASSRSHLPAQERGVALDSRRSVSVSPSVAANVNIRHILENVAESEGSFQEPQLAFRVAMEALSGPCWSTKVEGILALIRLAAHHQQVLLGRLHEIVCRVANETRNLRSTVARSAIFALGDFCARLERSIEPEMETIVQALLHKSIENTSFIREDIRRALTIMVSHLTQWRMANALITHGAGHKNMHVRRMASQFVALLVERMGPAKCLVGARDISAKLIPAAAKFAQDSSPHTRYYGRLILARIMQHSAFERLLRKSLTPNLYRSTVGIVESIKRRGAGDPPNDA